MNYLVYCPCGHSLERHGPQGCAGEYDHCRCPLTLADSLDAAIDRARAEAVTAWRKPDVPGDVSTVA